MHAVAYTTEALKALKRLDARLARRIREKITDMARDPYAPNPNATKLQGRPGYRLRVGDWRVIYLVEDQAVRVLILDIGPRGSVYR